MKKIKIKYFLSKANQTQNREATERKPRLFRSHPSWQDLPSTPTPTYWRQRKQWGKEGQLPESKGAELGICHSASLHRFRAEHHWGPMVKAVCAKHGCRPTISALKRLRHKSRSQSSRDYMARPFSKGRKGAGGE